MILGKNYFAPIDEGEDYFYQVDSDQNEKYETLESIYNEIFTKEQTQEAKDLSLYIRNKNKYIDKSLTYGEVTFRSMAYIFEYCKSRFDINEEGFFYDLGSGIGCGVISAALCFNFKQYIGIEFITALNNKYEYMPLKPIPVGRVKKSITDQAIEPQLDSDDEDEMLVELLNE